MNKENKTNIRIMIFTIITVAAAVIIMPLLQTYGGNSNYPVRFEKELNNFFGEGKWECVNHEDKKSADLPDYVDADGFKTENYYTVWTIEYTDSEGNRKECDISNHDALVYNVSGETILARELLDMVVESAEDEIKNDVVKKAMTRELLWEHSTLVSLTPAYEIDNDYYNSLLKKSWFSIEGATAKSLMTAIDVPFILTTKISFDKADTAKQSEIDEMIQCTEDYAEMLVESYGENIAFEIWLNFKKGFTNENYTEPLHIVYCRGKMRSGEELGNRTVRDYI